MKKRVPISQIMSTKLVTITPSESLYEAEALFKKHTIRHIPVVEGKKLVGVLSYSDLLRISFAELTDDEERVAAVVYDMFSVPQVLAKVRVTIHPETTIKAVIEILAKQTFHSLPVVENDELVGIVTTTDLLNYFLEQY